MSVRSRGFPDYNLPPKFNIARVSRLWHLADGRQGYYLMVGKNAINFYEDRENAMQHLRVFNRESSKVILRRLRAMKGKT